METWQLVGWGGKGGGMCAHKSTQVTWRRDVSGWGKGEIQTSMCSQTQTRSCEMGKKWWGGGVTLSRETAMEERSEVMLSKMSTQVGMTKFMQMMAKKKKASTVMLQEMR